MSLNRYLGIISMFLLIPFILGWILLYFIIPAYYFQLYPCLFPYFLLFSLFFYKMLSKSNEMEHKTFQLWFMGHTFFKLFFSFIIILLYAFLVKVNFASFVFSYLVFYFTLSTVQSWLFVKATKRKKGDAAK